MRTKETKYRFLREKIRLMRPYLDPTTVDYLEEVYGGEFESRLKQLPSPVFAAADRNLEERISIFLTEGQASALRLALAKQFGFSRLEKNREAVLSDILAVGVISSAREAELVQDVLADQTNPIFGSEDYLSLERFLRAYETKQEIR